MVAGGCLDGGVPIPGVDSEAFDRTLVETAPEDILTISEDSEVGFANAAIEDVPGYDPDALVGESILTLIPERLRQDHVDDLEAYLADGERRVDWGGVELPALHADGHEVPCLSASRSTSTRTGACSAASSGTSPNGRPTRRNSRSGAR